MITLRTHGPGLPAKTDLLVVGLHQKAGWPAALARLDKDLGGVLGREARREGFEAERGTVFQYAPLSGSLRRVLLLGLGAEDEADGDQLQAFAADAVSWARKTKAASLALVAPFGKQATPRAVYALGLGARLGDYRFDRYREKKKASGRLEVTLHLPGAADKALREAAERGGWTAEAVCLARDLVNEPACVMNPEALARAARRVAREARLAVRVLGEREIAAEGMRLFLSVGAGSAKENRPRFIHMTYTPAKAGRAKEKLFLVGKGVTFDSGGLSLKTAEGMMDMKSDMSGAAAVIATMSIIRKLKPDLEVHALVGATENMPDGGATRPGDIVRTRSGKTVEILNTDAEGRLTLADIVTYARDKGATEIVDLATLTFACVVALGPHTAGLFCNDDGLAARLQAAGAEAGEELWRLPLSRKMKKGIKSEMADLKNVSGGRYGGAITGALFIQEFVGATRWAHLDIAGPANAEEDAGHLKKGGRGWGVATLASFLSPLPG